jgi:hypothetical protein
VEKEIKAKEEAVVEAEAATKKVGFCLCSF